MRDEIISALGQFGTGLSQNARLITLASAQGSALPESLMAERFAGREAVNELFRFEVDALSTSTDLELDQFLGEEITLKLLQADGSRRAWHGICTSAAWVGADGGVARYRLLLEPALRLLRARHDCYIFQDKTVREIASELLADYPQVAFEFDLRRQLAPRPVCTQYRESDFAFLQRILASEGLNWRFEHAQVDDAREHARHKLVIFDRQAAPDMPGEAALRFHGMRATDTKDAIDQFAAVRQVNPSSTITSSWHPGMLVAPANELVSHIDAGELPALAVYDGAGERRHMDSGCARDHAELALQAFELGSKQFSGAGAVRQLAAGHTFRLTQHASFDDGDDRFTVLWVRHQARNNFNPALSRRAVGDLDGGTYRNTFGCVRASVAIVPLAAAARRANTAVGSQTALVVGLPGAVATATRDHQVKVQFAWQRGTAPNPGGQAHDTDTRGKAPGNDTSGAWVRVAEALAGPNWGTQFTPRIGAEVLVEFIDGDIDRPVIVAQLHNGRDEPPYSAGVSSGANHAGALSGIHSHNFDGGGYNQWQLDDTASQLRMRLASSTASTQLNLGYLIQQQPGSAQRGAYRGNGFELRTDAWGVVRGGEGVLVSTCARPAQGAGIASTQMDAAEALAQLKGAKELDKVLSDAARQQTALASKDAQAAQQKFVKLIDPKAKGKVTGAFKARDDSREADSDKPVEKFGAPIVMMDAPSTINWATPASTVMYAGQQIHWTAQSDLHFSAAHTVASVAGGGASFFTHAGGIQAIAGNGPLSLQAHTDALEILADKAITVISVNDCIEIKAKEKIVIQAGQSAITLQGGDITFACPGNFTVKGGKHSFDAGDRKGANLASLPSDHQRETHWIALQYLDPETARGIGGANYEIHLLKGGVLSGTLDDDGKAHHADVENTQVKKVIYKPRKPEKESPAPDLRKLLAF